MTGGRPPISAKRVTVTYTYTFQFLTRAVGVLWFDLHHGSAQRRLGDAHRGRVVDARRRRSMDRNKRTASWSSSRCSWQPSPASACIAWSARLPARAGRRQDRRRRRGQHPLPLGTRLTKDHVKLVTWPADTPGARRLREGRRGRRSRPHRDRRGERAADRGQAGAARGRGGLPPSIPQACAPSRSR